MPVPAKASRDKAHAEPTPEALAVRAQGGSVEAFSALVEVFQERLFNFLLRRTATAADAEDLAQETFIRAWERIGQYNPRWRFSTWLFTIGSRLAASRYRDRPTPPLRLRPEEDGRVTRTPDRLVHAEESTQIWGLAEEHLTPEQHTAVWLRYAEDMAIGDVARVMGKTQVGVRVMLFRARNILAEYLEETGYGQGVPARPTPPTPRRAPAPVAGRT
jgi:RNA polymerase sigma-70 factor (ECF subfamily)